MKAILKQQDIFSIGATIHTEGSRAHLEHGQGPEEGDGHLAGHGEHDDVHAVPVGVPVDLADPHLEVQVEPEGRLTICRHERETPLGSSFRPDPQAEAEGGERDDEPDDVEDEVDPPERVEVVVHLVLVQDGTVVAVRHPRDDVNKLLALVVHAPVTED